MVKSPRRLRVAAPPAAAVLTALAVFAGVAAGLPGGEAPSTGQVVFATIASLLSGAIAYWQVRAQLSYRNGTAHKTPTSDKLFQLPPDIEDFTGRSADIATLSRLLTNPETDTAIVVTALSGKGGVGKTTLAVHVAHQVRDQFPDGQMYVNLRGAEAQVLDPGEVLARFLQELGIDSAGIPEHLDDRARLYRARLADRRVLVVLDNAGGEKQVRPLLPGGPGCAVLLTSRSRLTALEGAHTVAVDVMTEQQCIDLLRRIIGPQRVDAELDAAMEIAELAGRLPLAIRIAGARLAARPLERLHAFTVRLRDEQHRLDLLKAGDLEVRACFALSYGGCDEELKRAFRLLGMLRADDFGVWTLAVLMKVPAQRADGLLERLVDTELLEITADRRYRFHDLLRVFAHERLTTEEPREAATEALERLLREYVAAADRLGARIAPGGPERGATDIHQQLPTDPRNWFLVERSGCVTAVELAFDYGLWDLCWRLAVRLPELSYWPLIWEAWAETHRIALEAARNSPGREGEAYTRRGLGNLHRSQGRYAQAAAEMKAAEQILADLGDELEVAVTRSNLGDNCRYTGEHQDGIGYITAVLPVFEQHGIKRYIAWALYGLGDLYRALSQWHDAASCLTRCITLFDEIPDRLEAARARVRFGIIYRDQCLYGEAERLYLAGLAVFREFGDRRWTARTLRHLGIVYRNIGETDKALGHFDDAMAHFEQIADHRAIAVTLRNKGDAYRYGGAPSDAESCLTGALERFVAYGDRRWEARTRLSLADALRPQRRWDKAADLLDTALAINVEIKDRPGQARVLRSHGLLFRDQGRVDEALACLERSQAMFASLGDQIWTARVMAVRAAVLQDPKLRQAAEEICFECGAESPEDWLHEW